MSNQHSSSNKPDGPSLPPFRGWGQGRAQLSIHIPTPCHENWDAMTPQQQGRFCQSCAKTVVDFTNMTDSEVLNYFAKASGNTCGRFMANQLQRPLQSIKQEKRKAWWIAAMMPLLLLFKKAEAQKKDSTENVIKINEAVSGFVDIVVIGAYSYREPTDYWQVPDDGSGPVPGTPKYTKKPNIAKLTVTRRKGDSRFTVSGKVISNQSNMPLAFASVTIKGSKTGTITDMDGHFTLQGNTIENNAMLNISSVGYDETDVYLQMKDTITEETPVAYSVKGHVVDAKTGNGIAGASIVLKNSNRGVSTDEKGFFTFDNIRLSAQLFVSMVGYQNTVVNIPGNNPDSSVSLGTIIMKQDENLLGDIVIVGGYTSVCKKPKKIDTIPAIIRKVFKQDVFKTYPNPAPRGSFVNIEVKRVGTYQIQLFNTNGSLVAAKSFEAENNTMQAPFEIPANLTAGMYYIKLVDAKKKKEYTDKIVIQ